MTFTSLSYTTKKPALNTAVAHFLAVLLSSACAGVPSARFTRLQSVNCAQCNYCQDNSQLRKVLPAKPLPCSTAPLRTSTNPCRILGGVLPRADFPLLYHSLELGRKRGQNVDWPCWSSFLIMQYIGELHGVCFTLALCSSLIYSAPASLLRALS